MLTAGRLRQVVDYDPLTGCFTWRKRTSNRIRIGDVAGHVRKSDGRRLIGIDGELVFAARLAVLFMTGAMPSDQVDHRNCRPDDDRWANLRVAKAWQNRGNTRRRADNTSGAKGVVWDNEKQKWRAQIRIHGCNKVLGRYATVAEAHSVYSEAALKHFGEFARLA